MNIRRNLSVLAVAVLAQNSFAGTMGPAIANWNSVITLSLGPAWVDRPSSQTFFLEPDVEKTYTVTNNTDPLFDGEIFYGVQHT